MSKLQGTKSNKLRINLSYVGSN